MIWVRSVCHSVRSSFTCFKDVDSTPEWLRPLWDLKSNNRWKGDKILKCFFGYLDLNISGVTSSPGWTPPARLYLPRTLKDSPEHAHFVPRRNTEMLKYLWTFKSPPLYHLWSLYPVTSVAVCSAVSLFVLLPFDQKRPLSSLYFQTPSVWTGEPTVIIKTVNLHIQSSFFFFNSTVTLSSSSPRKDNTQHLFNYLFSHHPKKMTNANSGPFPSWASKCSLVLKKVNPFRFLHIDMPIMSNRGIGIRQGNSA